MAFPLAEPSSDPVIPSEQAQLSETTSQSKDWEKWPF